MDAVNGSDFSNGSKGINSSLPSSVDGTQSNSQNALKENTEVDNATLIDLNSLGIKASELSSDVRPEAVERGLLLINDPNWLNDDSKIDSLAQKLFDVEGF